MIKKFVVHSCFLIYAAVAAILGLILRNSIFKVFYNPLMLLFLIPTIIFFIPFSYFHEKRKPEFDHHILAWYILISGYAMGWVFSWFKVTVFLYISLTILIITIIFLAYGILFNMKKGISPK